MVPIRIQYARIAPEAVNVNSSFTNTSVSDLVQTTVIEEGADPTIMTGFGGPVSSLGYLANNREGSVLTQNLRLMILVFLVALGFILNCLESTQYFPIIIFLQVLFFLGYHTSVLDMAHTPI